MDSSFRTEPCTYSNNIPQYTISLTHNLIFRLDFTYNEASLSIGIAPTEFQALYRLYAVKDVPYGAPCMLNSPMPKEAETKKFAIDAAKGLLNWVEAFASDRLGPVRLASQVSLYTQLETYPSQERYWVSLQKIVAQFILAEEFSHPNESVFSHN